MLAQFRFGEEAVTMQVTAATHLRDLQQELCTAFGQRFPAMMAVLTIDEKMFNMFNDLPFAELPEDSLF